MWQKILILFSFCLIITTTCYGKEASPPLKAEAALLMDAKTGQVLYQKNGRSQRAPASTTKVLTALLAIESGRLHETVKVSPRAASVPGSSMNLYAGQFITLEDLLTGLLLRSGNDAAVAIAEHLAGSVEEFAKLMNDRASVLSAQNSHFQNPHGLSAPNHFSSAYDLALITREALKHPLFCKIVRTKETDLPWLLPNGKESERPLRNTNKLLWLFADADGVKTGTTGQAGPCLVSSATRNGRKLIAVVLHDSNRWSDSMKLLQYGFDQFELVQYGQAGDILGSIPVDDSFYAEADCQLSDDAALVIPKQEKQDLVVECDLPETIKAPIEGGQKVGEVVFYFKGQAIKSVDVITARSVPDQTKAQLTVRGLLTFYQLLSSWGVL